MGATISTLGDAKERALAYLAERYPGLHWGEPSALRLENGWLVDAPAEQADDDLGAEEACLQVRLLVVVWPGGRVEEVEQGGFSRRAAHRELAALSAPEGNELVS